MLLIANECSEMLQSAVYKNVEDCGNMKSKHNWHKLHSQMNIKQHIIMSCSHVNEYSAALQSEICSGSAISQEHYIKSHIAISVLV